MKKWSIIQCFCVAAIPFTVVADPSQEELKKGLMDANPDLAGEAVGACAVKGEAFLPILRKWASSDDPRLRLRARSAIGRVTGQWGSQTNLVWRKSFKDAVSEAQKIMKNDPKGVGKPIMLLQLFGKLDREFC